MKLHFLSARRNLSKTFGPGPELIAPYPMVKKFTSHEVIVDSPEEFHAAVVQHADQGHCLLKGLLSTPIIRSPRAGLTNSLQTTEWICLDLDISSPIFIDIETFLKALGLPEDVTYIKQYSASAGITHPALLRCHLFFMLSAPQHPGYLKYWLIEKNLDVLEHAIEPTATGHALKYPLDITTCQNDKLLFIAPPTLLDPLTDPLQGARIVLVSKDKPTLTLPPLKSTPEALDRRIRKMLKPYGKPVFRGEVLTNPSSAIITGVRQARGFTYLNLNGGDSWGYYYPDDNIEVVYNFKGEPPVLLKALDPEFYAKQKPDHPDKHWVFRDRNSDTYYTAEDTQFWPVSSKEKINDYRRLHNLDTKEPVPVWTLEFLPTTTAEIDHMNQWINTFRASEYLKDKIQYAPTQLPPLVDRIITHLTTDSTTKEHLINWLAAVIQTRDKLGTCWLLHGVQGTGKGLLFHKVLSPILGENYCRLVEQDTVLEKFNGFRENALLIMVDEVKAEGTTGDMLINKIKTMVTETTTSIRRMFRTADQARVWDNIILTSNMTNPLPIEESDRRINVTPRVEAPLSITLDEIMELDSPKLLHQTAQFFLHYPVDIKWARTVERSEARSTSIANAASGLEAICMAIRNGDLNYFVNQLKPQNEFASSTAYYQAYDRIIRALIPKAETTVKLTRNDLIGIFNYLLGPEIPQTPARFTQLLGKHGIGIKPLNVNGITTRGITAHFKSVDPDTIPHSPADVGRVIRLHGE